MTYLEAVATAIGAILASIASLIAKALDEGRYLNVTIVQVPVEDAQSVIDEVRNA